MLLRSAILRSTQTGLARGRPARRDPRRRAARPARAAPHLTRRDNVVTAPDARELARFIRALRQLGALSAGHLA